ncbi:putative diaminohydroxyphosphoribosylamino-pyrimidine deaminase [Rosellinia necatrix]|uniref:Putative diaminohydroxyphosphoribosylamino-pyrimidine deaminase n=1 Tax=Rosellinia necatrix TaxID=77044 RepID=A0A1W2TE91_ROSNE|nr:putative diaminohydroxyphosphoribosylamino-pyrimidine deaminase [Rosellinia necatrix]
MALGDLFTLLGSEIEDPDEETFLLFSQDIPSQNLGFVDSQATTIDLSIGGKDYTVHQSPTLLNRPGSTTGAVIWKITPLVASWLSSPDNPLWKTGALSSSSAVLELGCGVSGLVGLVLSPLVSRYVLTDQTYVARLVEKNLDENIRAPPKPSQKRRGKSSSSSSSSPSTACPANLRFAALDWELDEVTASLTGSPDIGSFDAVIACDCIYNDTLIGPLVQTCADACNLRRRRGREHSPRGDGVTVSTLCIVAQQLRDSEIFEGWIKEFGRHFHVWRVPEEALSKELRANTGFVVHVGILKTESAP